MADTHFICDWNYSDLISQEVDFGYTNPTENQQLSGERKHFVGPDGKEKFPTDVPYPAGVSPRHEKVFLATTLEELITTFPNNRINVEIKQSGELGLKALKESCIIDLYTDSKYVLEGATKWLIGWKSKKWKKADNKPVLNQELWQTLDALMQNHQINWHWVKGHDGHPENERVDSLACQGRDLFANK